LPALSSIPTAIPQIKDALAACDVLHI
jgi:histidinol-phosphate aminotransferase